MSSTFAFQLDGFRGQVQKATRLLGGHRKLWNISYWNDLSCSAKSLMSAGGRKSHVECFVDREMAHCAEC